MGAKRPKSLVIYMYLRSMPKIFITSDFFNIQSSPLYYQKSYMHNSLAPTYYLFRVNDTSKTPKFSFQFFIFRFLFYSVSYCFPLDSNFLPRIINVLLPYSRGKTRKLVKQDKSRGSV